MSTVPTPRDESPVDYIHADADGRISQTGRLPRWMLADQVAHMPEGGQMVEGAADVLKDYVKDGARAPRPENTAVLNGMKISNVPNPSAVTIGTESPIDVQDGEVDLEFTYPGTYTITVSSWPYLDAIFTVTQQ